MDYVPGQFLGNGLEDAIQEVEALLKTKPREKSIKLAAKEYITAMQGFNAKRTHIESTLKMHIPPLAISPEELNTSIQYLGDNISAALQFGDMEHLSEEMEWLKLLLQSYDRPKQELVDFMEGYSQAVDANINGQGDPIKKWLRSYALERT